MRKNQRLYVMFVSLSALVLISQFEFPSFPAEKSLRFHQQKSPTTFDNKFPNVAIADLFEMHDRLLLKALLFFDQLRTSNRPNTKNQQQKKRPFCLVVLASNRQIPYIKLLMFMLTQGHSVEELQSLAEIHVLNVEQRANKQSMAYLADIQKLGFVHVQDYAKEHIKPGEDYGLSQRKANRHALGICKSAQAQWCILMEDDALPPAGFFRLFKQHIAGQLDKKNDHVALVKLFEPFNNGMEKRNDLYDNDWVEKWYLPYRAKRLIEKQDEKNATFKLPETSVTYGAVANAFTKMGVKLLIDAYDSYDDLSKMDMMNDVFMTNILTDKKYGRQKIAVEPSLVTHIGLFSEQRKGRDYSKIFADVRFQPFL